MVKVMELWSWLTFNFTSKFMIGFQTYWTRPRGRIDFQDFEILTIKAAILLFRRLKGDNAVRLYADPEGIAHFSELGLCGYYDDVVSISVPLNLDPARFWAAGKMYAYSIAPIPYVSIDLDAIVFRPFWLDWMAEGAFVAMALHPEPLSWECYKAMPEHYTSFFTGFNYRYDWSVPPFNVGVLGMFDRRFNEAYWGNAFRFMQQWSKHTQQGFPYDGYLPGEKVFFEEQVLIEQRFLAMLAKQYNKKIGTITVFNPNTGFHARNDTAFHLWSRKYYLRENFLARAEYMRILEGLLYGGSEPQLVLDQLCSLFWKDEKQYPRYAK